MLILESKKSTCVTGLRKCDECGVHASALWRYAKSNKGTVYLCSRCQPVVLDRSHGKVDVLDLGPKVARGCFAPKKPRN